MYRKKRTLQNHFRLFRQSLEKAWLIPRATRAADGSHLQHFATPLSKPAKSNTSSIMDVGDFTGFLRKALDDAWLRIFGGADVRVDAVQFIHAMDTSACWPSEDWGFKEKLEIFRTLWSSADDWEIDVKVDEPFGMRLGILEWSSGALLLGSPWNEPFFKLPKVLQDYGMSLTQAVK